MTASTAEFERQHARLDGLLHAHMLDIVGADFVGALGSLQRWQQAVLQHIQIENTQLLPLLPAAARWPARVYLLEHERIELLAQEHAARLQEVAAQVLATEFERRTAVLALIDGAHALRHVLEHHHMREEQALALELPAGVAQAVWAEHRLDGA